MNDALQPSLKPLCIRKTTIDTQMSILITENEILCVQIIAFALSKSSFTLMYMGVKHVQKE